MANKNFIAHLEIKCFDRRSQQHPLTNKTFTTYHSIVAPSRILMDKAILNYAMQVGAVEVNTITPEEYESKTQIQS